MALKDFSSTCGKAKWCIYYGELSRATCQVVLMTFCLSLHLPLSLVPPSSVGTTSFIGGFNLARGPYHTLRQPQIYHDFGSSSRLPSDHTLCYIISKPFIWRADTEGKCAFIDFMKTGRKIRRVIAIQPLLVSLVTEVESWLFLS